MICKICNKELKNYRALSIHLRSFHNISLLDYEIQYNYLFIPKCIFCDKNTKRYRCGFSKTCGSKECINKLKHTIKHTDETKEKLRKKRFEYLKKKTGNTAYERRSAGIMSYLEQWFFDECIIKYNLLEKYDIVNEYAYYPYFIDFAFLNIKLAVELDGACHFKNGDKRIEHDIKKDSFLLSQGWKIFRINYKENTEDKIKEFISILYNINDYNQKIFDIKLLQYKEVKNKKQRKTRKEYFDERKQNIDKKEKLKIDLILNSGIDFSKFGWVNEVAKIINKNSQKVNKWMKRYMLDFYEKNCFKRINNKPL